MTKAGRFYWLKLKEDFFDDETIEWLEEQENGKEYCLFYLKLCLKSLKKDGYLIRDIGTLMVPYSAEKIAEITKTKLDTVMVALSLLKKLGLVEETEEGALYLPEILQMTGSESSSRNAQKQKAYRERQKQIKAIGNEALPPVLPEVVTECPTEYRDKSIEIRDKSIDIYPTSTKSERKKTTTPKTRYLESVDLTDVEYQKLVDKYGNEILLNEGIVELNNYKMSSGKKYKSDYHVMIGWVYDKIVEKHKAKPQQTNNVSDNKYEAMEEAASKKLEEWGVPIDW